MCIRDSTPTMVRAIPGVRTVSRHNKMYTGIAAMSEPSRNLPTDIGLSLIHISADSVIEITVTKPGQEPVTSNIRVLQSDLELLDSLKDIN